LYSLYTDAVLPSSIATGVIQLESIFYDTPSGLMPNKERALQHSYPVLVMELLSGGDLLHRIDARARAGTAVSEKYLAATFRSAMLALQGIHKRFFIHSKKHTYPVYGICCLV
jgi:hypothetical protein